MSFHDYGVVVLWLAEGRNIQFSITAFFDHSIPWEQWIICHADNIRGLSLPGYFSWLALMVMCIERYLGVYYPILHKTSVTKRRLLTFLAILIIPTTTLVVLYINDLVISDVVALSIYMVFCVFPFMFFNYKLFKISRKMRRQNGKSPEKRKKANFNNINACLLVVACLVLFSVPLCMCLRRV